MKFKFFKWYVRLWDLLVVLFLVGYFFFEPFRVIFDSAPYFVKAGCWLLVVLFFYYSILSWYVVIKQSIVNVINSPEFEDAEDAEGIEDNISKVSCDFVTGSDNSLEKGGKD